MRETARHNSGIPERANKLQLIRWGSSRRCWQQNTFVLRNAVTSLQQNAKQALYANLIYFDTTTYGVFLAMITRIVCTSAWESCSRRHGILRKDLPRRGKREQWSIPGTWMPSFLCVVCPYSNRQPASCVMPVIIA